MARYDNIRSRDPGWTHGPARTGVLQYVTKTPGAITRQITTALGFKHREQVRYHLNVLEDLGFVRRKEEMMLVRPGRPQYQNVMRYYATVSGVLL